jgi:hypothetical protein
MTRAGLWRLMAAAAGAYPEEKIWQGCITSGGENWDWWSYKRRGIREVMDRGLSLGSRRKWWSCFLKTHCKCYPICKPNQIDQVLLTRKHTCCPFFTLLSSKLSSVTSSNAILYTNQIRSTKFSLQENTHAVHFLPVLEQVVLCNDD